MEAGCAWVILCFCKGPYQSNTISMESGFYFLQKIVAELLNDSTITVRDMHGLPSFNFVHSSHGPRWVQTLNICSMGLNYDFTLQTYTFLNLFFKLISWIKLWTLKPCYPIWFITYKSFIKELMKTKLHKKT